MTAPEVDAATFANALKRDTDAELHTRSLRLLMRLNAARRTPNAYRIAAAERLHAACLHEIRARKERTR